MELAPTANDAELEAAIIAAVLESSAHSHASEVHTTKTTTEISGCRRQLR